MSEIDELLLREAISTFRSTLPQSQRIQSVRHFLDRAEAATDLGELREAERLFEAAKNIYAALGSEDHSILADWRVGSTIP